MQMGQRLPGLLTPLGSRIGRWHPALLLLAIAWLNWYICRELFSLESTARMNSMHGFWAAIARWSDAGWWTSTWWPYWDGGIPFEYTYAPGVPACIALIAHATGWSELRSLYILMGIVYTLGPAVLYLSLWLLTRSASGSFAAAAVYTLCSPALLLAPNQNFSFPALWNAERLYAMAAWDETPHMAALALWPVAVLHLLKLLETGKWKWITGAALAMAGMVYFSAFGSTLSVMTALAALAATGFSRSRVVWVAIAGALAYLASCIAMPPSLISLIGIAASFHGEGLSVQTLTGVAGIAVVWAVLLPSLRQKVTGAPLRFFLLFTGTSLLIVWFSTFWGRNIVPQPGRYKAELSLGLAVCSVFALLPFWKRCSPSVRLALTTLLVSLAAEQVVGQRRWAKNELRLQAVESTIEYRAAQWMDANLAGDARVMLPGSMAQWLNAFSRRPQWTGSSWSMAANPVQQRALKRVYEETGGAGESLTWFRAYGVTAVAVSGPQSPEFWKPFADKTKYEGKLPLLWREEDTSLYRVPLRTASLAHSVPATARSGGDWDSVERYVAALDGERLPGLGFQWTGRNQARIGGTVLNGEAVSVQITHHPGWSATANGTAVPLEKDGLGLLWLRPSCEGPCTIDLTYKGGTELVLCRVVSVTTFLGLASLLVWNRWKERTRQRL